MPTTVVVLAGGRGSRLSAVTGGLTPKALVPVLGEPFVDVKLRSLQQLGVRKVLLLVGEHGLQIEEHVGPGSRYGIDITCVSDGPTLLGTGGAVANVLDRLDDAFWVTYGDTIVAADLDAAETRLRSEDLDGLMCVLRNEDEWERSNVDVAEGLVQQYAKGRPSGTFQWIDYGLLLLTRRAFTSFKAGEHFDLEVVVHDLIERSSLVAWPVEGRFWEIGTPAALADTEAHLRSMRRRGEVT